MNWKNLVPWKWGTSKVPVKKAKTNKDSFPLNLYDVFNKSLQLPFFSNDWLAEFTESNSAFFPKVDVIEQENEIIVKAELPGLEEKDIDLTLTDEALIIRGERKKEEEREENNIYYFESSYGSFERVVPLDTKIDSDRVEADLNKGILTVRLPKEETGSRPRKVSIKTI